MLSAIIVAGGNSTRMNGINKQFLQLENIPVILRSVLAFEQSKATAEIIIVTQSQYISQLTALCKASGITKLKSIVNGGETRSLSVQNGFKAVSENMDFIAVHDGARPLITPKLIDEISADAIAFGASAPLVPVKDTIKIVKQNEIVETPDRATLYQAQTPQIFRKDWYKTALFHLAENSEIARNVTDECSLLELDGRKIHVTMGDYSNMKITTPEDIQIAAAILKARLK